MKLSPVGVTMWVAIVGLCGGCEATTATLEGLPCGDEPCVSGYICHPETLLCVLGDSVVCPQGDCSPDACDQCICQTYYRDNDADGLGDAAISLEACSCPEGYVENDADCDDANHTCANDCTDNDADGTCEDADCNDAQPNCTTDCTSCLPLAMELVQLTPSALVGFPVQVEIRLAGYTADATQQLHCQTSPQIVFGPINFTGSPALSLLGFTSSRTHYENAPDQPFGASACAGQGVHLVLEDHNTARLTQSPIDATNLTELALFARLAQESTSSGNDSLGVRSCCNASCAEVASVPRTSMTDALACTEHSFALGLSECGAAGFELRWGKFGDEVGVDDLRLEARTQIKSFTKVGNVYRASFIPRASGSLDLMCTWSNTTIGAQLNQTLTMVVN